MFRDNSYTSMIILPLIMFKNIYYILRKEDTTKITTLHLVFY